LLRADADPPKHRRRAEPHRIIGAIGRSLIALNPLAAAQHVDTAVMIDLLLAECEAATQAGGVRWWRPKRCSRGCELTRALARVAFAAGQGCRPG
jgi:hypothetical protein